MYKIKILKRMANKNKKTLVSVVVTAYNIENYIEECLNSVFGQTYSNIEVIVVCDKPTDRTCDVVHKVCDGRKNAYIIENDHNVGAGMARKIGVDASRGDFVMTVDGDDIVREDFIESLVNNAEKTGADVVSGGITLMKGDGTLSETVYGEEVLEGYDRIVKYWGSNIVYVNNKIIKRELYNKIEYCTRPYIEDTSVIIPLLWYASKVSYINNPGYVYRMRGDSLTHQTNPFKDFVYKTLSWCDLMEFFNEKDPKFFEVSNLRGWIVDVIKMLNNSYLVEKEIDMYKDEWCEVMRRLINLISIDKISYKIITFNQPQQQPQPQPPQQEIKGVVKL